MDKVVIIDGYEFLGFHLCDTFLETGVMVDCIYFPDSKDIFREQKQLLVGRNANFSDISWSRMSFPSEPCQIILSFYDFTMNAELITVIPDLVHTMLEFVKTDEIRHKQEIINLLPINFLVNEQRGELGKEEQSIQEFQRALQENGNHFKNIYLPTLYGPGQSKSHLFQQTFLNQLKGIRTEKLHYNEREWVHDAIFVRDAVDEIVKVLGNHNSTEVVLSSSLAKHWKKCADYLTINIDEYVDSVQMKPNSPFKIPTIKVGESIGYQKGLDQQKQHLFKCLTEI